MSEAFSLPQNNKIAFPPCVGIRISSFDPTQVGVAHATDILKIGFPPLVRARFLDSGVAHVGSLNINEKHKFVSPPMVRARFSRFNNLDVALNILSLTTQEVLS